MNNCTAEYHDCSFIYINNRAANIASKETSAHLLTQLFLNEIKVHPGLVSAILYNP